MLKDYLENVSNALARLQPKSELTYHCLEAFVVAEGKEMGARSEASDDYPKGTPRECYKNALELAMMDNGLTYCEGFAKGAGLIPVLHAWCLDAKGRVIDPTWAKGEDYFGVEFPVDYALKTSSGKGTYGLIDNWEQGYPLLKGEKFDERRDKS